MRDGSKALEKKEMAAGVRFFAAVGAAGRGIAVILTCGVQGIFQRRGKPFLTPEKDRIPDNNADTEQDAEQLADADGRRGVQRIKAKLLNDKASGSVQQQIETENVPPGAKALSSADYQEYKHKQVPA